LAIRVAGDPYGVPLGDVAGLYVDRTVVAIPSKNPALLGVAGFRGTVAPVYDLRALLGYPPSEDASSARLRWLLLIGGGEPISVAFEQFETQLRVAPDAISTADEGKAGMTRGTVRGDGIERPVLSLEYLKARVAAPR
jgi:purine-binding chemotaxis protein CheW